MWKLGRGWWLISLLLLIPGVVEIVSGIADPLARTDDGLPQLTFGLLWVLLWLLIHAGLLGYLAHQKKKLAYFREHGVRGVATIVSAETTGTTINDMPQIELQLEIALPDRKPYAIRDRRCWNPLSLAGLQKDVRLPVLVDPRKPKKILFIGEADGR